MLTFKGSCRILDVERVFKVRLITKIGRENVRLITMRGLLLDGGDL